MGFDKRVASLGQGWRVSGVMLKEGGTEGEQVIGRMLHDGGREERVRRGKGDIREVMMMISHD